jgi:UDP-glucose 4-epimerase
MGSRTALVTGGAGFIGSHVVDRLCDDGWRIRVLDDLSSGNLEWIQPRIEREDVEFMRGNLNDRGILKVAVKGCDTVFHIAADPSIRGGFETTARRYSPIRNNVLGTHTLLESMIEEGPGAVVFSSSSVVYGRAGTVPTPEDYGPMKPISLYGASKLACEGLITAYADAYGLDYWIFRFANIVGSRSRGGVVNDFVSKLRATPGRLEILGDGRQRKCYLHASDCVDGMLACMRDSHQEIFNLGTPSALTVERVAEIVEEEMGLKKVVHEYTGGSGGWMGDLPTTILDHRKAGALGWTASMDSEDAVRRAVGEVPA